MSKRQILPLGNPVLPEVSRPVDPRAAPTRERVRDLADTLFVRLPGGFCDALCNPVVQASAETFERWDDCFSFPEIDHLDGILATQRAIDPTAFCTREEYLRRHRPVA